MPDVEEDHEMQNPSSDPVPAEEDEDMEEVSAPTKQARVAQQDIGEEDEEGGDDDDEEDDEDDDEEDDDEEEEDEGRSRGKKRQKVRFARI